MTHSLDIQLLDAVFPVNSDEAKLELEHIESVEHELEAEGLEIEIPDSILNGGSL